MGQCASTQMEHQANDNQVRWLKNYSNGSSPPTYLRIVVRHLPNESQISGYYRNISIDFPEFNASKDSSADFPVYMRVLSKDGQQIKPQHVHYLYSRDIVAGCCWVITEYNALRKHPEHGYFLSAHSYHNTSHYFSNTSDDSQFSTQLVNLERLSADHNRDHTNIYKIFSADSKECDTCTVSVIPIDSSFPTNITKQYMDTAFHRLFATELLYFDVDLWTKKGMNEIESFKRDRERVFEHFFGHNGNKHMQYHRKFKQQNIDKSKLKLFGVDSAIVTQYDEAMASVHAALSILNPNDVIKDIIVNKTRYDRVIEQYIHAIEHLVCTDKEQKEVLNMVFPYLYKEEPWKNKKIHE